MQRIILTMPIAPYEKFSVGKMSTPILAETLAKKMNAKFIVAVNLIDSYKERSMSKYKMLFEKYNIHPDEYWVDKENINKLLEKVYILIEKGYIYSKTEKILSCDCKKVEISQKNLATINMKDSNFIENDNEYYCKYCHSKCYFNETKVLVFNPNLILNKDLYFYPEFLNKDIKTFFKTVGENEFVITRMRETGMKINYKNEVYNLDVDFLWQVYLSLFPNTEKIVLCSNHQLYQLFMVAMLEKCFDTNGKTICLATPYLNIEDKTKEQELEERILSLKIFSLLNQKWSKKENTFDESLLKYINHMNVEKKQKLYDLIVSEFETLEIKEMLKLILTKEFNKQILNQKLKRRKNV